MSTIDDLAQNIAQIHNIKAAAAREMVSTYVDQISDDEDLWDADTAELTATGVRVVTDAIDAGYANDVNSSTENLMLTELEDVVAEAAKLEERRDDLIRRLMDTTVARKRIAAAANLSEPRLYQINHGR